MSLIRIAAEPGTRALELVPGGFAFKCGCGDVTPALLDITGDLEGRAEIAVTCGSCTEVHWFMVSRSQPNGGSAA